VSEYLSRPVFETAFNWVRQPATSFRFDLRSLRVGFGRETFHPLQQHVVQCWLRNEDQLADFEEFFDALRGRVQGFWLPSPQAAFVIEAGFDATRCDVTWQDYEDQHDAHPSQYIRFRKAGEADQYAKVLSVLDLENGRERVTFDASVTVDETWTAVRLHYVRLADGKLSGEFDSEQRQSVELRVVELTEEYTEAETGERPVYLYHFYGDFGGTQVHWRFTSYWETLTADGETWTTHPMTHGGLTRTLKGDREQTTVEAVADGAHPLSLFVPFTLPVPLWVVIYEATLDDIDTLSVLFTGQVEKVQPQGPRLIATVSSLLDVLSRKVPRFVIGPRCNYALFESHTCKVNRATFEKTVTIDAINGRTITVSGAGLSGIATDWFSEGWIEVGTGADFEIRTIVKDTQTDTTEHELLLNYPLNHAAVTDSLKLLPGDDRRLETCTDKFSNEGNFGGHQFVPQRNLTLQAIQASPGGGGKK
jgi:uncharacterized phage protein (TIGR02218 family)